MTEDLTEEITDAEMMSQAMRAFGLSVQPRDPDEMIDRLEARMLEQYQPVDCRTGHTFTPGMYARSILMPAGTMLTSKIHKTKHQFVILKGDISVWTAQDGSITYHAPYHGITLPGTRRVLFAHTDTVWVTFHPTDETDLEKIEEAIIMKHVNPHLERILS